MCALCCAASCQCIVGKVFIINDADACFSISDIIRINRAVLEVMYGPEVTQQKNVLVMYYVMREAMESVQGDRSAPVYPCKADSSWTTSGDSFPSSSSFSIP